MSPTNDDEIDLFELFKVLWDGKWLISASVTVAVLLGGGYVSLKTPKFESVLEYSVALIPPFYDEDKAFNDFREKFYSVSVFEEWKRKNVDTSLVFEHFSQNQMIDGILLSKNENTQLATLKSGKGGGSFVVVKSNQLTLLNDFFTYTSFISDLLKVEYIMRAKDELNIIETRFKDFSPANDVIVSNILTIDRYVVLAEKGTSVFDVRRPTIPQSTSPKSSLILTISAVLGGMVGALHVLIWNAIRKRTERLAKS